MSPRIFRVFFSIVAVLLYVMLIGVIGRQLTPGVALGSFVAGVVLAAYNAMRN